MASGSRAEAYLPDEISSEESKFRLAGESGAPACYDDRSIIALLPYLVSLQTDDGVVTLEGNESADVSAEDKSMRFVVVGAGKYSIARALTSFSPLRRRRTSTTTYRSRLP